jgi:serine/threonine protein kinase
MILVISPNEFWAFPGMGKNRALTSKTDNCVVGTVVVRASGAESSLTAGGGGGPPDAIRHPGEVVAGYLIEGVAGRGATAVVYRARDTELDRLVALKLISPSRARDPRFRELLIRESLTAASLEHPNIIPIYRAGTEGSDLYIAMRFVDGASLLDLILAHGRLPAR